MLRIIVFKYVYDFKETRGMITIKTTTSKIDSIVKFPLLLLILSCLITACHHAIIPIQSQKIKSVTEVIRKDVIMPMDSSYYWYSGLHESKAVFNYYNRRAFSPVWFENRRLTLLADSMIHIVDSARLYGLLPQDYHHVDMNAIQVDSNDTSALTRMDVLLTDAFFSMANHMKHGRLHSMQSTSSSDSIRFALLDQALRTGEIQNILNTQEPNLAGYKSLKKGLRQIFDTISFEDRGILLSGITNDSLVLHKKIQRIEINLERWRWENQIPDRYIWINIPSFELCVVENDKVVMQSKVIVGATEKQTPLLSSLIECFVIYPYWHVPRKIAIEELLPLIQADTSYLRRKNFDVLDRQGNILDQSGVQWETFTKNYFPVVLRQQEGSENSLGVIKFVFDNPYAVYLHDTNAKRLFSNKTRALSHGCIRMEKAEALAHYLVTGNINTRAREVDKYLALKQKHTVNLRYPIPIYTRYFTCENSDEELHIYPDIYNKDSDLILNFYDKLIEL